MQTAVGVFGSNEHINGIIPPESREEIKEDNVLPKICPRFIATDLCRERVGVHPCDKRRDISEHQPLFPAIDFSMVESNEDNMWKADVRETDEELVARGLKFMNWLWTFQERDIAIVTHNRFSQHTLNALANDCEKSLRNEICEEFGNCELRSMVIADGKVINVEGKSE
uniref:Phosphoglycerate mutase-like protein 1 n=1 Tax=Rhizophora mucronata TaxID=61149 RepID=A0A2P2JHE1_RHIMU